MFERKNKTTTGALGGAAPALDTAAPGRRVQLRGMGYEEGRKTLSPDGGELTPERMKEIEELKLDKLELWELEKLANDDRQHIRAAGVAELMARDAKSRERSRLLEGGGVASAGYSPEALKREPGKKIEREFGNKPAEEAAPGEDSGGKRSWRDYIDTSFKFSPSVQVSHFKILQGEIKTRALDENTKLKTERGVVESENTSSLAYEDGGVEIGKKKGVRATAYKDWVDHKLSDTVTASAGLVAGEARAQAGASVRLANNGVKVKGNAGASAMLVGGNLRLSAVPTSFKVLGEEMSVNFRADVDAKVLAEAKGDIAFDVSKGDKPTCQLSLGGSAFAGAKAGVTLRAFVKWNKKPSYMEDVKKFVYDIGPDFLVDKIGERSWDFAHQYLIGMPRWAGLLGVSAGATASAGAGAEASADIGFSGGKVQVSGKLGATVGLGAGVSVKAEADVLEAMHFAAVMLMRGGNAFMDGIPGALSWIEKAKDAVLDEIERGLEAAEKEGGFAGKLAGAASTVGRWVGVFD